MARVVFFGSPEFAVPSLEAILPTEFKPVLVVTQPDRRAGRGKKTRPTAVRTAAEKAGIEVLTCGSFKEEGIYDKLSALEPDYFAVTAFGLIFPRRALAIPAREPVNVHASLLPAYRGASPVNMAVVNGETVTGITTMRMVKKLDAGPIFLQGVEPVEPDETAGDLSARLAVRGGELLVRTLEGIESGDLEPKEQPGDGVSFAPLLKKKDGLVPWDRDVRSVHNHIRGMNPWPGSHTYHRGNYIKILRAMPSGPEEARADHGVVVSSDGELLVGCGRGLLKIEELQAEGRKPLAAEEFMRGYELDPGDRFGEAGK